MTLSKVDFPAPLSPKIAYSRPVSNRAVISRRTANRPKSLLILVRIMGASDEDGLGGVDSAWPQFNAPTTREFSVRCTGAGFVPGWFWSLGAYFDAHFACSIFAWKTPSRP